MRLMIALLIIRNDLINFLFINTLFLFVRASDYAFEVETIFSIRLAQEPTCDFSSHPIDRLSHQERGNMCSTARELMAFDAMDPEDSANVYFPYAYYIRYPDGRTIIDVAIWCWTIPKFYLRFGNCTTKIKILLMKNEFASDAYKFHVEIINSTPSSYYSVIFPKEKREYWKKKFRKTKKKICWSEVLENDRLSSLLDYERLYICFTAKRHVKDAAPVLKSSSVGIPKVYVLSYPDRRRETRVAFKCPSTPVMYVHFGESNYDIHILLLQNAASFYGCSSPINSD